MSKTALSFVTSSLHTTMRSSWCLLTRTTSIGSCWEGLMHGHNVENVRAAMSSLFEAPNIRCSWCCRLTAFFTSKWWRMLSLVRISADLLKVYSHVWINSPFRTLCSSSTTRPSTRSMAFRKWSRTVVHTLYTSPHTRPTSTPSNWHSQQSSNGFVQIVIVSTGSLSLWMVQYIMYSGRLFTQSPQSKQGVGTITVATLSKNHMWDSDDLHYWYPNRRTASYITDTPTDTGRQWRIHWIWCCGRRQLGMEDMHGFNKPKNIQIGPELREIWLKQIVWHVLIIYPLYMSRCECSWACQIFRYWWRLAYIK